MHYLANRACSSLFVILMVSACSDETGIIASCRQPTMSDGSRICIDANEATSEMARMTCRVARGDWVEGSSCDRDGAIGGCETSNGAIFWHYPSERMTSIDDLVDACDGLVIPL